MCSDRNNFVISPNWRQAMMEEMAALHSNNIWDIVTLPPEKNTMGCRWVYTVKVGPDGQIDRFKAHCVSKDIHIYLVLIMITFFL